MNRVLWSTLVVLLVLGRGAIAGGDVCKKGACRAGEKVSKLIENWKAAAAEAQAMTPVDRAKMNVSFTTLRESCPVGSRIGETLIFTKSVLDLAIAADSEHAKACSGEMKPAATSAQETEGVNASTDKEVCRLMAHRSAMAGRLRDLVSFAVAAMPTSGESPGKSPACGAGATAATSATEGVAPACHRDAAHAAAGCPGAMEGKSSAQAGAHCAKGAETASACHCSKALTAKAEALKASWEKAPGEYASMCPVKKDEIFTAVTDLQKSSKVMSLLPETVITLADGLAALDTVDCKIQEKVKDNPDMLKRVPAEVRTRFDNQALLVRQAKDILFLVRSTMDAARKEGAFETPKDGVVLQH